MTSLSVKALLWSIMLALRERSGTEWVLLAVRVLMGLGKCFAEDDPGLSLAVL